MNRRTYFSRLALMAPFGVLAATAACAPPGSPDGQPGGDRAREAQAGSANELILGHPADSNVAELDAHTYDADSRLQLLVYEPLILKDADDFAKFHPALATKWEPSEGGTVWTLTLRPGVKFHDGTPFDARAVAFNVNRIMAQKTRFSSWQYVQTHKDISAVGEHTVRWAFTQPSAIFLEEISYTRPLRMVSPAAVSPTGDPSGTFSKTLGTGPWKLESSTPGQLVGFTRFEDYWGSKPAFSRLTFKLLPNANTRMNALRAGAVDGLVDAGRHDFGYAVLRSDIPALEQDKGFSVTSRVNTDVIFMYFNFYKGPTADLNVRRAVALGVDRDRLAQSLFPGMAVPANEGMFPAKTTKWSGAKLDQMRFKHDPAEAARLLDAAGWARGTGGTGGVRVKEGQPLNLSLLVNGADEEGKLVAQAVQSMLAPLGIGLSIKLLEGAARSEASKNRDFDLSMGQAGTRNVLSLAKGHYVPTTYFNTPETDRIIKEGLSLTDAAKIAEVNDQLATITTQQVGVVPLYYSKDYAVFRRGVSGFAFSPQPQELHLSGVTVAKRT